VFIVVLNCQTVAEFFSEELLTAMLYKRVT